MRYQILGAGALLSMLAAAVPAQAQPIERGMQQGAAEGGAAAGPVGAIVGGVLGGAAGAVRGVLGIEERPRFRAYVVREQRPSYRYRDEVTVGTVLPSSGVQYYEIPAEYGAREYRYTVVNERTVLVDPRTHQVVEIVE